MEQGPMQGFLGSQPSFDDPDVNRLNREASRGTRAETTNRRSEDPAVRVNVLTSRLDRLADVAELLADLLPEEDEGNDRDDRDEREDQRVLGETLAFLFTIEEVHDGKIERSHCSGYLLSVKLPDVRGLRHGTGANDRCQGLDRDAVA